MPTENHIIIDKGTTLHPETNSGQVYDYVRGKWVKDVITDLLSENNLNTSNITQTNERLFAVNEELTTQKNDNVQKFNELEENLTILPSSGEFKLSSNFIGWQGVTVANNMIYVFSDRNENFGLENIISVYNLKGELVTQKRNAYTGTDPQGRFMSFGDANYIDGSIYVTAYNLNSGGSPLLSRVVRLDVPTLNVVNEYNIGGNVAESVTRKDGNWWVVYHDLAVVRRFNNNFNLSAEYPLEIGPATNGGPQGSLWDGDVFYVNLHGPNSISDDNLFSEVRSYTFDGNNFTLTEVFSPPTLGCGQGLGKFGNNYIWNNRINNSIVITDSIKPPKKFPLSAPVKSMRVVEPELANGYSRFTETRTVRILEKEGIVYFTGLIRTPSTVSAGNDSLPPFYVPEFYSDSQSKNFVCASNIGPVSVSIANKNDSFNSRKVVIGRIGDDLTGIQWISFDGVSYPLL